MSSLDEIANAVLAWQRQHPLALPLGPEAVHSIGLVALPFVRAAEGSPPPSRPWWRFWEGRSSDSGDRAAFSEDFIEGLRPEAVARFALRHGVEAAPGHEDWPLRRVAVDSELAEAAAGGWPYERWLASAAVEGPQGRLRVLVSLQDRQPRAVLGRRHWDRRRLAAAAAVPVALLALVLMLRPAAPPPRAVPTTAGAVEPAVLPPLVAASAPASVPALLPASEPASMPELAVAATAAASAEAAASAPPIDIRPRLGPQREGAAPKPPLRGSGAPASAAAPAPMTTTAAAAPAASASAVDPERPSLRPVPPGATPFALVSPGFAKRAEADALLARMLDHAQKTVAQGSRLQGEVVETPQGFRAAVYPFASREEAALINATMVARGWKTRAVEF